MLGQAKQIQCCWLQSGEVWLKSQITHTSIKLTQRTGRNIIFPLHECTHTHPHTCCPYHMVTWLCLLDKLEARVVLARFAVCFRLVGRDLRPPVSVGLSAAPMGVQRLPQQRERLGGPAPSAASARRDIRSACPRPSFLSPPALNSPMNNTFLLPSPSVYNTPSFEASCECLRTCMSMEWTNARACVCMCVCVCVLSLSLGNINVSAWRYQKSWCFECVCECSVCGTHLISNDEGTHLCDSCLFVS